MLWESLKLLSQLTAPITTTHQQTPEPAGLNRGDSWAPKHFRGFDRRLSFLNPISTKRWIAFSGSSSSQCQDSHTPLPARWAMQTAPSWSLTLPLLHHHCNVYKVHGHYVSELQLHATFSEIAHLLDERVFDFQAPLQSSTATCWGFMGISWVFNEAYTVTNLNNSWSWKSEAHSVKLMEPETPREKYWMN